MVFYVFCFNNNMSLFLSFSLACLLGIKLLFPLAFLLGCPCFFLYDLFIGFSLFA